MRTLPSLLDEQIINVTHLSNWSDVSYELVQIVNEKWETKMKLSTISELEDLLSRTYIDTPYHHFNKSQRGI